MTSSFGPTLDALLSDDLADAAFCVGAIEPLLVLFRRRDEVANLRTALETGAITNQQITAFVDSLTAQFKKGTRFIGDVPLSAIAVAFEGLQSSYAMTYLQKLAALDARELPVSRRVAQRVLRNRASKLGGVTVSRFPPVASPLFDAPYAIKPHRISSGADMWQVAA